MLREADEADNAQLLELLARVEMGDALAVTALRSPDYFALHRMQGEDTRVVVDDEDGVVRGLGVLQTRTGYLHGMRTRIGTVCDVRAATSGKKRVTRREAIGALRAHVRASGCDVVCATMMAENEGARSAFVSRAIARRQGVRLVLAQRYHTVCVPLVVGQADGQTLGVRIERAAPIDVPEITRFLDADHRHRPLGYDFASGEFERRLTRWPGFSLDDTYLARTPLGTLAAVCTVWDAAPVRRYRITRLPRALRIANALARLTGRAPLPMVGDDIRSLFLTNLSVRSDDPDVFSALLARIHADRVHSGHHLLQFPLFATDPLAASLEGRRAWRRFAWRIPFELHRVVDEDQSPLAMVGRPGIEIALA